VTLVATILGHPNFHLRYDILHQKKVETPRRRTVVSGPDIGRCCVDTRVAGDTRVGGLSER